MDNHPMKAALRTEGVRYAIRDVVAAAQSIEKQGKKVLYLNIGDPLKFDFETPRHMIDAVSKSMLDGHNGYSDSRGVPEARAAIAAEATRKGVKGITAEDVIVTAGASEGITMALGAILNPGENVLTPSPGYPQYTGLVNYYGAQMNPYYLDEDNGWMPDVDDIRQKINDKTKAIIVINPNNPTGSVCDKKIMLEIIEIAKEHNLIILSDEIYDKLIFEGEHYSPAALTDEVPIIIFNGLSKSYLVPGWRVGWTIFYDPKKQMQDVVEGIHKLARLRLCSVCNQQFAIKPALEGPQDHIAAALAKLKERRDFTVERINSIPGLHLTAPHGAFYAFAGIDLPVKSDKDFVLDVLREEGVLFVFGSGFGQKPNTNHFRIVFLPDMDALAAAYDKLERFVKKHY